MKLAELQGEVLGGRFRLGEMVGRGGFGAVFSATQLSVERPCAVKVLVPGPTMDQALEKRFRSEAKMTSRLSHPNTVVVYDFGVDESRELLFLATEFLDGKTLHDVLKEERRLDVAQTINILDQVAGSLGEAHALGMVHRDIKPKNLMLVRRAGQTHFVKVIDFGIAKTLDGEGTQELTRTGMLVGTPHYMSPEQLLGQAVDGRSDQYAMAVIAYRMLTGRNPFCADTAMQSAIRHIKDRPLPLRACCPELAISAEFEQAVLKGLAKSPGERFASVGDFVNALKGGQLRERPVSLPARREAGRSGLAQNTSESRERAGANRRSRWIMGLAALSALVFLGTLAALFVGRPNSGDSAADEPDSQNVATQAQERARADEQAAAATADNRDEQLQMEAEERWDRQASKEVLAAAMKQVEEARQAGRVQAQGAHERARQLRQRQEQTPSPAVDQRSPERQGDIASSDPSSPAGQVTVTLIPWGTLYVDDQPRGDQVRQAIELAPGTYDMTLRQRGEIRARQMVDVTPGESKMVVLEAQFESDN